MIHIQSSTIAQAWRGAIKALYERGRNINDDELFRDSVMTIEVSDTTTDHFDDRFPMSQRDVEAINNYLVTGKHEDKVVHDWTKLYRNRLFDSEPNQIQNVIEYLRKKPMGKRAQASVWQQEIDLTGPIAPCLQLLWFQIYSDKLDIHVHMRASDCYGKLLMNMNEFVALQQYMAKELGVEPGTYYHFIDTCHFNSADKEKIENIVAELK
ncbi:MAG: thymidylate synthase [Parcubacteria group bacterium Gr01-1014_38]|nr:MAG: thymidylate synthase [Parcubacteria group bacterium Gr01-1014_38]